MQPKPHLSWELFSFTEIYHHFNLNLKFKGNSFFLNKIKGLESFVDQSRQPVIQSFHNSAIKIDLRASAEQEYQTKQIKLT